MSDWKETVGHDFTPEFWRELRHEGERLVMDSRTLAEIRKMQEVTQTDLAAMLGMTRDVVAQLEEGSDIRISTLRTAIEKMGGSLKIVAEMPGKPPVQVSGFD